MPVTLCTVTVKIAGDKDFTACWKAGMLLENTSEGKPRISTVLRTRPSAITVVTGATVEAVVETATGRVLDELPDCAELVASEAVVLTWVVAASVVMTRSVEAAWTVVVGVLAVLAAVDGAVEAEVAVVSVDCEVETVPVVAVEETLEEPVRLVVVPV